MAAEPSYPDDAPVGDGESKDKTQTEGGEDKPPSPNRTRHIVTGAAIGIGSAALVAALLYARRSPRSGGGNKE
jgi:hypothetical protein